MDRKILVIGLDGATWDILRPAIESGYLPTLKSLVEDGFYGDMKSTLPPITPVAWTSFMTGVNPAKHSISGFAQPSPIKNGYQFSLNNSQDIAAKTLWEYLSEQGQSIVSLNLPMTYPPFPVNGALVSGLMTPNARQQFTHPPELQEALLDRGYKPFIKHIAGELSNCESKMEYKLKIKEMCELVEQKFEQAEYIDKKHNWDIFFLQIQEIDAIQHFLLGFYEEGHDWQDKEMTEYVYKQFYGMIDRLLGKTIETIGENALTIVLSDHGFQTSQKVVYLGNWLHDEGFADGSTTGLLYRSTVDLLKKFDVLGLRRRLTFARKIAKQKESFTLDWGNSDAISIGAGNNPIAPIYILRSGARSKEIRNEIISALNDFQDPNTGQAVVEEVIIGDEVYDGPHVEKMPDLLVKGTSDYTLRTTRHADEPTIVDLVGTTNRPGVHHRTGIVAGKSNETVGAGHRINGRLVDMFPTFLYYLGEPIPEYVDGEVLDIFTEEFREENEMYTADVPLGRDIDSSVKYSQQDKEDIKDTLSQFGYID
jgi:predicted AlkP superfamily phosphohydrolase/phosphomutase